MASIQIAGDRCVHDGDTVRVGTVPGECGLGPGLAFINVRLEARGRSGGGQGSFVVTRNPGLEWFWPGGVDRSCVRRVFAGEACEDGDMCTSHIMDECILGIDH